MDAESRAMRKVDECQKKTSKLCAYFFIRNRTCCAEWKLTETKRKAHQCAKTVLKSFRRRLALKLRIYYTFYIYKKKKVADNVCLRFIFYFLFHITRCTLCKVFLYFLSFRTSVICFNYCTISVSLSSFWIAAINRQNSVFKFSPAFY